MIYLDNAATTLMYPEVRDTVSYYEKYFYNPSSPYSASKKIRKELEKAREKLADLFYVRRYGIGQLGMQSCQGKKRSYHYHGDRT